MKLHGKGASIHYGLQLGSSFGMFVDKEVVKRNHQGRGLVVAFCSNLNRATS
jgi:hypothetical protein